MSDPERRRLNLELDYEERMNSHVNDNLDDRLRDDSRIRLQGGRDSKYALQPNDPLVQGLSDERALHHMEQSQKKASILKIGRAHV